MGKPAKGASVDGAGGKKQERRKRKQVLDGCSSGREDVGEETDGQGLKTGEKRGVTGDGVGETVIEVKVSKQRRQPDGDGHVGARKKKKKMTMADPETTNKKGTVEEMDRQVLKGGEEDKGVEGGGPKDSITARKVRTKSRETVGDDVVAAVKKKKTTKKKKMGGEDEAVVKKEDGSEEGKLAGRMNRKSQVQAPDMQGDIDKLVGASEASPANNDVEGTVQKDNHASVLANDKAGDEGETAVDATQSDGAVVPAKRKHRKPRPADFLPLDVKIGDGQVTKNTRKKRKGRPEDSALIPYDDNKPRVIFLSRVPHGFYEDQMLHFFGQFGTVTRMILSRNKKSGASRHYAFIEFQSSEVAAIVADCLHNYLIDGKILQCKLVPPEKVHPKTFFRANRVFKPWLGKKRHKVLHDRVRNPEKAALLVARLRKRDNKRRAKLKVMGIEYDFQGYASLVPPKRKHVKFAADDEQTAQEA
eukprot:TRINITY_DN1671_c0_g1_i2.p1 TRINITY_DN1671_c0_g1~~TRINITY_DN1671_c0_g1_i2.p1  ORF type:complete len:474 (+),score=140.70 TRINITY_DN1671_c0_g1_i2:472-1893(+)